jgi:hypothetical protein
MTDRYRVGGKQPGNIYKVTPEHPEGKRFGFTLRDEDGPLVVAALNAYVEPESAESSGPRTLTVTWHPDAIRRAVDHALAVLKGDPDAEAFRIGSGHLTAMDLACLIDAGRAFLDDERAPTVHRCHSACPCEGNPVYRQHMQHPGFDFACPFCPSPEAVSGVPSGGDPDHG